MVLTPLVFPLASCILLHTTQLQHSTTCNNKKQLSNNKNIVLRPWTFMKLQLPRALKTYYIGLLSKQISIFHVKSREHPQIDR